MKKKSPTPSATPEPSRRSFIRNAALAAAGFYIVPRHVLGRGFTAPSDRLTVAGIGAGGKGESDLWNFFQSGKADIVMMAREFLRDPRWPLHAARELGVDISWPLQLERGKIN